MKLKNNILFCSTSLLGCIIMILRCVNNDFWADETYTINAVNNLGYRDMFSWDPSSPPLYFIILKVLSGIGGKNCFVYHFVSCIPLLILVFFAALVVYKQFDSYVATLFVLLLCFQPEATTYFIEVRPYAWSALFVFFCFWTGYQLLKEKGNSIKKWVLFNLWGILAAYSHYWAFGEVIVLYFCFFFTLIILDKSNIRKCIFSVCVSLCSYLPGLLCFVKSMTEMSRSFWIEENVPFISCLAFFVYDGIIPCLLLSLCIFVVFLFAIKSVWSDARRLSHRENKFFCEIIVLLVAIIEIVSVFLVEVIYGTLVSPLFVTRYLFPIAPIIWFSIAELLFFIDHEKIKRGSFVVLFIMFVGIYGTRYYFTITNDITNDRETKQSIGELKDIVDEENTIIVTDIEHLEYGVLQYYLPGIECALISDFNENSKNRIVFLLSSNDNKTAKEYLSDLNLETEWKYCGDGKISRYQYYIYMVSYSYS